MGGSGIGVPSYKEAVSSRRSAISEEVGNRSSLLQRGSQQSAVSDQRRSRESEFPPTGELKRFVLTFR